MASNENFTQFNPRDIVLDENTYEAGGGTFRPVWFGFHAVLHMPLAIKIFFVTGGQREKELIKHEIETSHLQTGGHENIVRVLGYVHLDSAMGIVMEYCQYGNLKILLLDKRIPLSVVLRVRLLLHVAKALESCHTLELGCLVHADVKPDNILLGFDLICKLCDFDTATLANRTGSRTSTSAKSKSVQCTPWYTAPERLNELLTIKLTREMDVYAFALVVHMVLTRNVPFPSDVEDKVIIEAVKKGYRPNCEAISEWKSTLSDCDKAIVESLEDIMRKCWKHDPSERSSMTEVCQRLEVLLSSCALPATAIAEDVAATATKMNEIYPQPTTLDQRVPLDVMWTRKIFQQESTGTTEAEPSEAFGTATSDAHYIHVEQQVNIDHAPLPQHWEDMTGQAYKRAQVPAASPEFERVRQLFCKTLPVNAVALERIQNIDLWNQFQGLKQRLQQQGNEIPGQPLSRELFFACDKPATIDKICEQGFQKAYKHGEVFSRGWYFKTTARSLHEDAVPDQQRCHRMFLAEVATGAYCAGNGKFREAPTRPNGKPYDSVVDNFANPTMFVVFRDASAYPAYLLTYTLDN